MDIKKVSIIGLGALGVMYGNHLAKRMPWEDLRIVADSKRITRYKEEHVFCNGELCEFNYVAPKEDCDPADLLIFSVKINDLEEAVNNVRKHVGENTIIISLLNGISSEDIIGETYGFDKVLYCVAHGMDAVKEKNLITYEHMGTLSIGDIEPDIVSQKVKTLADFFEKLAIPCEIDTDMRRKLWGKFMLNVGVNQTVAIYESKYGEIQKEGPARDTMISAMKEVMALSEKVGINLNEEDLKYWLNVISKVSPKGKPSMRQDLEAKRLSEVELFAGTVLKYGKKYNLATPTNRMLYERIKAIESTFK